MIRTLAFETSCDDTSLALVTFDGECFQAEKMIAFSQIATHQQYGGVVPELASRLHEGHIVTLLDSF
jgi:N6-L-threonylcarbamoyladenine synthase